MYRNAERWICRNERIGIIICPDYDRDTCNEGTIHAGLCMISVESVRSSGVIDDTLHHDEYWTTLVDCEVIFVISAASNTLSSGAWVMTSIPVLAA